MQLKSVLLKYLLNAVRTVVVQLPRVGVVWYLGHCTVLAALVLASISLSDYTVPMLYQNEVICWIFSHPNPQEMYFDPEKAKEVCIYPKDMHCMYNSIGSETGRHGTQGWETRSCHCTLPPLITWYTLGCYDIAHADKELCHKTDLRDPQLCKSRCTLVSSKI